jgi:hypothetical protein
LTHATNRSQSARQRVSREITRTFDETSRRGARICQYEIDITRSIFGARVHPNACAEDLVPENNEDPERSVPRSGNRLWDL